MSDEKKLDDPKPAVQAETRPVEKSQTGAEKAAAREAAGEMTDHEKAAKAETDLSPGERALAFLQRFRHNHAHNAPRTTAELAEIEALLAHMIGGEQQPSGGEKPAAS